MRKEIILCDLCKKEIDESDVCGVSYKFGFKSFEVCVDCEDIIRKAEQELGELAKEYNEKAKEIEEKWGINI